MRTTSRNGDEVTLPIFNRLGQNRRLRRAYSQEGIDLCAQWAWDTVEERFVASGQTEQQRGGGYCAEPTDEGINGLGGLKIFAKIDPWKSIGGTTAPRRGDTTERVAAPGQGCT